MLGHKLIQKWQNKFDVWSTIRSDFQAYESFGFLKREKIFENINVEEINSVENVIKQLQPEVIINAVGLIKQLPTSKDVIKTLSINSIFPHQLAGLAGKYRARLLNISTDCVFSGKKGSYTESDIPDADDLYGKSKQLGETLEDNCLTLRTSIIGRELKTSHSMVEWFLSNRGKKVKGFVNAIYTGFPTVVLAGMLSDIIENYPNLSGLYHVSSEPINKFDLLHFINKAYDARIEIEPFEDFEIDRSLDSTKFRAATGFKPPEWGRMIDWMAQDNALYQN